MEFQKIVIQINNAFFRLESFMNNTVHNYQYFGFNKAFTELFNDAIKSENYTYNNCKLISKYWQLTEQLRVDFDKGEFENSEAYENEMFCKDCEEIMYLNYERIDEFTAFSTPDEIEEFERKFSITDINKSLIIESKNIKTKTEILVEYLIKHGFYELEKVKILSEQNKLLLISQISKSLPFAIAMFNYLGYLKHLSENYFKTKNELNTNISKWFNRSKDGRLVKGNINTLSEYSKENKERYTAHKYKEEVIKYYKELK